MISGHEDLQKATSLQITAALPAWPLAGGVRRRNRTLAMLLAVAAASGFLSVLALALLLHYAEAHDLFVNL